MALIDKKTIRKEIERQRQFIGELFTEGDNTFYDGQDDAYNHILAFLDSLPEQPVEGLEDDNIIDYAHSKFYYDKDFDGYGHSKFRPVFTREDLISFARHFVEWQKKQDQETIELAEDHAMLAGMNKMEQQIIQKAYDTIMQFDELNDLVPTFEDMQKFGFKEGDKVKVIILKEK